MEWLIGGIVGLVLGAVAGVALAKLLGTGKTGILEAESRNLREQLDTSRAEQTASRSRLDDALQKQAETQARLEEQQKAFDISRQQAEQTFQALSAKVLQANSEQFLEQARRSLQTILTKTEGQLGEHREAVKGTVKPLQDALQRYEQQLTELEKSRKTDYGSLRQHLEMLAGAQQSLQAEAKNLSDALRSPKTRGIWGEMQLRRLVELAGMKEHVDFEEQVSVAGTDGTGRRQQPDMIIHLPDEGHVIVDAKVSLEAYVRAVAAKEEEERTRAIAEHTRSVTQHVNSLKSKGYWESLKDTPRFVIMFVPGESFLSAALEESPDLLERALEGNVILASPTSLFGLLRTVALFWRTQKTEENAQQIAEAAQEIYKRLYIFYGHFADVGKNLETASRKYNKAASSWSSRLMPYARRLKDLRAVPSDAKEPKLESIEALTEEPAPPALEDLDSRDDTAEV